jgi:pimeloyl-ACP methyl ester carboxylesterase
LHVYLDGDGTPWEHKRRIADDPTSRQALILDLLRLDPAPAIMLGRPCYHGFSAAPECDNKFWTAQRYSRAVVDSMAEALRLWLREHRYRKLVFIGYSGGGVLAVLLAPYFENTAAVLTAAANLDVEAWSRYHGYNPLTESLNPATQPPLDKRIRQMHVAGKKDPIVPLAVVQSYADRQADTKVQVYDDYDHVCCWKEAWPAILALLRKRKERGILYL